MMDNEAALTLDWLNEGGVAVWFARTANLGGPELLAKYRALLSDEERQREDRYRVKKDRSQHLTAWALVRTVLSRYAEVAPKDWGFTRNQFGKPRIAKPENCRLQFNVSHTTGLAICAVVLDAEIGVDAERFGRSLDAMGLAQRFFADQEIAVLENCPEEEHLATFFRIWTLKEAYLKALGTGLTTRLDSFTMQLPTTSRPSPTQPPRVTFLEESHKTPQDWHFAEFHLHNEYQIALALHSPKHPNQQPFRIPPQEVIPLAE